MLYPISSSRIDESVKMEISPPIVALSFDSNSIFEISPSTIHTYPSPGPLPPPPKPYPFSVSRTGTLKIIPGESLPSFKSCSSPLFKLIWSPVTSCFIRICVPLVPETFASKAPDESASNNSTTPNSKFATITEAPGDTAPEFAITLTFFST